MKKSSLAMSFNELKQLIINTCVLNGIHPSKDCGCTCTKPRHDQDTTREFPKWRFPSFEDRRMLNDLSDNKQPVIKTNNINNSIIKSHQLPTICYPSKLMLSCPLTCSNERITKSTHQCNTNAKCIATTKEKLTSLTPTRDQWKVLEAYRQTPTNDIHIKYLTTEYDITSALTLQIFSWCPPRF